VAQVAVCSEIDTKHIYALCGQNTEFMNVEAGGKGKGKAILLQAWTGHEGFQWDEAPRFQDNRQMELVSF